MWGCGYLTPGTARLQPAGSGSCLIPLIEQIQKVNKRTEWVGEGVSWEGGGGEGVCARARKCSLLNSAPGLDHYFQSCIAEEGNPLNPKLVSLHAQCVFYGRIPYTWSKSTH